MVKSDAPRNFKDVHIPPEWKRTQLVEVIKDISMGPFGSDITISNFTSSGVPVLNGKNISAVRLTDDIANYVTELKAYSLKKAVARRGDVVVTHRGTLGQIAYIPENSKYCKYVISQSQFRITFIDTIDVPFLVYFFHSPQGQSCLLEGRGHTGVPAIAQPTTTFRKIYVHLPPRHEQTAIAEALSDVDGLIASLQKLIAKKKAIKQGAMQELLTGKRRLPGFYEKWKDRKIGDFTTAIAGGTPSTLRSEYWGGDIPWMNSGELHNKRIFDVEGRITRTGLDNSSTSWIPEHSVLVGLAGQGKTRGTVAINHIPLCTNQSIASILPNNESFSSEFLYQILDSKYEELRELSTGDGGRGGLNLKLIKNLLISWPSLEEQTAIAQVLSDIDAEIEQLEKKLAKYQQIKQGMMQELLTGRIRLAQPLKATLRTQEGDAAIMAGIVDMFYSDDDPEKYPLGRKKVQKLMYMALRHEEYDVSDFMKMAAGPYSPSVRYNSEPIAVEREYIATEEGHVGTKFFRGKEVANAKENMQPWLLHHCMTWLTSNFKWIGVDDLELFATVDMAICDLRETHQPVSVQSIKGLLHSTKEWREKLDKDYFSDQDIQRAINKCRELFGEQ